MTLPSRRKSEDDDDDDDEEDAPRLPGTISKDFLKTPNPTPFVKRSRPTLGPHLEPLRTFELTDRASLGVIGQADRVETRFGAPAASLRNPSTVGPSIRARDVGAGMSLEFKLGQ